LYLVAFDLRKQTRREFMYRRLGQSSNAQCAGGFNCPQILEMPDGDFAVVGKIITEDAKKNIPLGAGVGPDEGVVKVPRRVMAEVRSELPACV
jgi:hypothetical protein